MAKRVLVPLDQSLTAESAVPMVADLARGAGAVVRLLHVAPEPDALVNRQGRVVVYVDQEVQRLDAEAADYLRAVEARLEGIPVEVAVRFGDPTAEILHEAEAFGADLIVLTTTGRSALGRAVFGSVAESVFRKARAPVLLFHPRPEAVQHGAAHGPVPPSPRAGAGRLVDKPRRQRLSRHALGRRAPA